MIDPARSFERDAVGYESARPEYPSELLGLLPDGEYRFPPRANVRWAVRR
jgi:hypothetical protein